MDGQRLYCLGSRSYSVTLYQEEQKRSQKQCSQAYNVTDIHIGTYYADDMMNFNFIVQKIHNLMPPPQKCKFKNASKIQEAVFENHQKCFISIFILFKKSSFLAYLNV